MAKSQNPIDQHRRAQRKKELARNKTKRISFRDAKVAATQSLKSVQSEIKSLERKQKYQEGHLDSKDTKKLERLRKELKIVITAEEKRKKEEEVLKRKLHEEGKKHLGTKEGVNEWNEEKFGSLAKSSVYYDPTMNPYGAPPPGKPKMYWAIGGGKTIDPRLAFIPKELRDNNDPADGVVNPLKQENGKTTSDNSKEVQSQQSKALSDGLSQLSPLQPSVTSQEINSPHSIQPSPSSLSEHSLLPHSVHLPPHTPYSAHLPPPPLPPPLHTPLIPSHTPKFIHSVQNTIASTHLPPSPPKPSQAVQRFMKKKSKRNTKCLLADVWASNEELKYESCSNLPALAQQEKSAMYNNHHRPKKDTKFINKEQSENDPLCPSVESYSDYRNHAHISKPAHLMKSSKLRPPQKKTSNMDMWHYRDIAGNIQGPYPSHQMIAWKEAGFFLFDTLVCKVGNSDFVSIGSACLNQEHDALAGRTDNKNRNFTKAEAPELSEDKKQDCPPNDHEEKIIGEIEKRIKVLRAEKLINSKDEKDTVRYGESGGVSNTIKAEKISTLSNNSENVEKIFGDEENLKDFFFARCGEDDMVVVPYRDSQPVYPVQVADNLEYPISKLVMDETDVVKPPWPLDAEVESIPYPSDVTYPIGDDHVYPDTDSACVVDVKFFDQKKDGNAESKQQEQKGNILKFLQNKKVYKGDKEVIGFVPSHLQVRRRLPLSSRIMDGNRKRQRFENSKRNSTVFNPENRNVTGSVDKKWKIGKGTNTIDDYDKFMQDISTLK